MKFFQAGGIQWPIAHSSSGIKCDRAKNVPKIPGLAVSILMTKVNIILKYYLRMQS
ncbi:hypothetical protein AGRO_1806 [Agrobacterium sp. ATCC 31749]|nr:hypothetical protein AGRO_1806 [Agrobacterium sp. ATCC 31749]